MIFIFTIFFTMALTSEELSMERDEGILGSTGWKPYWLPPIVSLPEESGLMIRVSNTEDLMTAIENAVPGTTVLVEDGKYRLPRFLHIRNKRSLIIKGLSGDPTKVILQGKGWDSEDRFDDIIRISSSEDITIANLTFCDCHSYGIKVEAETSPKNIKIFNCHFHDIGTRAIKGSAGTDPNATASGGSVQHCYFENTKVPPSHWQFNGDYVSAIDMMSLEDWIFSDNFFRNVKGRNGAGRAAIFIWVRSRRIIVERNVIVNCDRGIAFGNPGASTANIPGQDTVYVSDGIIRNNFISGGPFCGIEIWHSNNIKVYNNSIWRGMENFQRGIWVGAGSYKVDVVNNLIHGDILLEGGQAWAHNNLTGKLDGYFVSPEVGDLRLTSSASRAIGQGIALPEVTDDVRKSRRKLNPDIGAWETD